MEFSTEKPAQGTCATVQRALGAEKCNCAREQRTCAAEQRTCGTDLSTRVGEQSTCASEQTTCAGGKSSPAAKSSTCAARPPTYSSTSVPEGSQNAQSTRQRAGNHLQRHVNCHEDDRDAHFSE